LKGSIQKRIGKKGVIWTVVVDLPRDRVTGKRRQKWLSAKTKKEVERLAAQTIHSHRQRHLHGCREANHR
jgi:hypothetical protein